MRWRSIFSAVLLMLLAGIGLRLLLKDKAVIRWSDVHQTIDGFGGSCADFYDSLTPAQADFFFTNSGIGLSILRTQIIPDRATCDAAFRKDACSESNGKILNGELASAKAAVARGAIVVSTPWSPPGAYKTNGTFTNGGSLLPSFYPDWAKSIASYVKMMAGSGVPIYAVSVQNEPDLATNYGSCVYSAQQIHDFVPFLYSALHEAGTGSTKIAIGEQSTWAIDRTSAATSDPKVAVQVAIIAAHGYQGKVQPFATGTAHLWQTEDSSQSDVYDGSMTDGLYWGKKIHSYLTVANVNAWMAWFLTNMPRQGEGTDNSALTDINGNYPKRAFVLGQWSKFVRPGWVRIGVRSSGSLLISAFKDPKSRAFAIVAVNTTNHSVNETFWLAGFSAASITPWTTSESQSLAAQPSFPVSGDTFSYALPAASVTTFSGTATPQN